MDNYTLTWILLQNMAFFVNEKEFNKVIKAISSGIIVLTKFSDVNINDINLQSPQLFVNGLSFFDNCFNNSFIRNSFNVGSNPPCKSKLLKPHCISWHSIWMLPYKYLISNKVKEVLYKNVHRCYPVNATVSRYIHSVCDKCTFFKIWRYWTFIFPLPFFYFILGWLMWAGVKSCWKMKSASLKSWSAEGSMKCPKWIGKRVQWCWFSKNTMDQHQQMTLHPNHHRLCKLYTGLQATWAMSFSTLLPDSRTLVSKWNTKLALIWKEDFGQLGNSPVLLLLSPVKTPLTTTVAKFLDTSVCGSWCLDPSLSPFLVKFTQILESILLDNPHKAAVLLVGCASFSSILFPSTQLSVNMLGYSTLWTASFFGN